MSLALEGQNPKFALIVGGARSGTTLLRLLLDAHPEIGCPAEAGVPGLMSHMARVWSTINADILEDIMATDPGQPDPERVEGPAGNPGPTVKDVPAPAASPMPRLPEPACDWIRASTLAAMRSYCDREHKRLYVDKSLDSVYYLELVRLLFPDVRCVLAFRHVMDTIASGIEASPWGFQAYGYEPYVQRFPGNTVAALGSYWVDHVGQALAWEKQHPELCVRVRYEDLVTNPEETVTGIQRFLGVRENLGVLHRAFGHEPAPGPADYKIEHTSAVHTSSIEHGKRVPVSMLPPPLLSAINEKLEALGYPPLDRSWNTAERGIDALDDAIWTAQLRELMDQAHLSAEPSDVGVFAVVAEDHHALRWIIDTEASSITEGDGDVEAVLTGTAQDLVLMLTDQENLGTLLRSGRIRHLTADEDQAALRQSYRHVKAIIATLRSCLSVDSERA